MSVEVVSVNRMVGGGFARPQYAVVVCVVGGNSVRQWPAAGCQEAPEVYNVDRGRMMDDIGYEIAPLRKRILEHITDARAEAGMDPLSG